MKKVYPTLKTAETPQSSVIPVSIDASALPKDPDGNIVSKYRDVPDAIGSYYTDLLSKPEFQRRVGGVEKARELAKKLNSIKLYRGNSWLGEGGFSNPITGNITLYSPYFRPDIGIHETGHQMMDASPEYAKRLYDVADRHGLNYSPVYLPIPSDYFYRHHPYELGAELQSLRFQTNLMPGTGTGAGGRITPKDVNSKRWMFEHNTYFNDIDDDTISDFLNNAKSSKPAVHGRTLSPYAKTAEDNTMTEAYLSGFRKTAEEHGVDPVKLIKIAISGKAVRSSIGLARKIPDLAKLLERHRDLISRRILKSVALRAYEAADPIRLSPVHGHLRFQDHFRLRRKLLQFIEEGKIPTPANGQDLRRLANRIRFSIGRGSSSAFPDPKGIKTPVIELGLQKSKDLGNYIGSNILRHEFGHLIDLHGTSFGRYLDKIIKFTNIPSRHFWNKGLSSNPEIRANLAAGLPRITPDTDTHFVGDATPRELIDLIRKYPLPKPNLPK